jgi:hypothetical protein
VLSTIDGGPHAMPVATLLRDGESRILLALARDSGGSLARLREPSHADVAVLGERDIAFTAFGRAHVLREPMDDLPEFAAVELLVDAVVEDNAAGFEIDVRLGERDAAGLRQRVAALGAARAG